MVKTRRVLPHAALTLAVLAGAAYLARYHWPVIRTGTDRLAVADHGWLFVAAVATGGTWVCSALAQQGAVTRPLPTGRLVAAQFAASAANHVLPAGLGAGAVNLRFLTRCGLPVARSATALGVKATAGAVARAVLIAVLATACPGVLRLPGVSVTAVAAWGAVAATAVVLLRGPLRRAVRAVLADVRAVHRIRPALPRCGAARWPSRRCTPPWSSRSPRPSNCRCHPPGWRWPTSPRAAPPSCCPPPAGSARWTRPSSWPSP